MYEGMLFTLHADLAGDNTMEACLFISCAKISQKLLHRPSAKPAGGGLVSPHPLVAKSSVRVNSWRGYLKILNFTQLPLQQSLLTPNRTVSIHVSKTAKTSRPLILRLLSLNLSGQQTFLSSITQPEDSESRMLFP